MSHLAENRRGADQPRMVGRVRHVELPLLRGLPDQAGYYEHLAADGRRVFVSKQVLRDLAELERREAPVETAGLLFGGYFSDGRCSCTVVTKLVEPLPGEVHGTRSAVTITPAGAERMLSSAAREDPVLTPVGWAHTPVLRSVLLGDRPCRAASLAQCRLGWPGAVGPIPRPPPLPRLRGT